MSREQALFNEHAFLLKLVPRLHPDTEEEIKVDKTILTVIQGNKIDIVFPDGRTITGFLNSSTRQNFCEASLFGYDL
jgi:hypothetical protein